MFQSNLADGGSGGAIDILVSTSFDNIFTSCTFLSNYAGVNGGGVFISSLIGGENATFSFDGCDFLGNTADSQGGALATIQIGGSGELNFDGCTFNKNEARGNSGGGAINCSGYIMSVVNCDIIENEFTDNTGMFFGGGGIVAGSGCVARVEKSRIKRNRSAQNGGGIALLFSGSLNITGEPTKIVGNEAMLNGGGIYVGFESPLNPDSAVLLKNSAAGEGEHGWN